MALRRAKLPNYGPTSGEQRETHYGKKKEYVDTNVIDGIARESTSGFLPLQGSPKPSTRLFALANVFCSESISRAQRHSDPNNSNAREYVVNSPGKAKVA
jgi:hypothetical protein